MFPYINKALGRNGEEQKEKPIIITTWAVVENVNPYSGKERWPVKQYIEMGLRYRWLSYKNKGLIVFIESLPLLITDYVS